MNEIVDSGEKLVSTWSSQIGREGVAEIQVDEYFMGFTMEVVSKACFANNYSEGEDIFLRIRGLIDTMSARVIFNGIPILRLDG